MRLHEERSVQAVCDAAAEALSAYPDEIPFALLYLSSPDGGAARLAAAAGWSAEPPFLDLTPAGRTWETLAGGDATAVEVAGRPALALPLLSEGQEGPPGLLLAGLSARHRDDRTLGAFLELVAAQVGTALAGAQAWEERERRAAEALEAERACAIRVRHTERLEAVGQLAGGVAHAFNNLLCSINGFAGLLMGAEELKDGSRTNVGEILEAGTRAAGLTRQLLAYSRRQLLHPAPLDLNDVVERVEPLIQRLVGRRIDVQLDLEHAPGLVLADAGQIEQVLLALAENARDAMPEGGDFTIATGRLELPEALTLTAFTLEAGAYVVLAVADTGVGIAPGTREHVFEPFFTTKGMAVSSGLGLATVYGIVKQSGGHIDVESTLGDGTTFRIYLPVLGRPARTAAPAVVVPARIGARTILVVEDEEPIRKFVMAVLEPRGYTVLEAADGVEALAMYERHAGAIDLVVTDVVMPRMGGKRLVEKLTARRPDLPVIYMSGYTEELVFEGPRAATGPGFLQKPFAPDALTERVVAALAVRS